MLRETGRVVAVDEDGLWFETLKKSACGQCAAKSGCGQRLLAKASASDMVFVKALFQKQKGHLSDMNELIASEDNRSCTPSHNLSQEWQEGDIAVVEIDENVLVKATLVAYILPLLCMVLMAWMSSIVLSDDLIIALMAFVGLFLGGFAVRWISSNGSQSDFHARVVGKTKI